MPAYLRELSPPASIQLGRAAMGRWCAWAAASGLCSLASWRVAAVLDAAEPTATVWPPSGVLLAALLAARPQLSALWLGGLLGSLLGSGSLELAFLGATGSLAGAVAARRLLGPWGWRRLHGAQGTMVFAGSCLAGGALAAALVWSGHALAAGAAAWRAGLTAFGSQAVSLLIVAPTLVLWSFHRRLNLGLGRDAEALALLGAGIGLPAFIFLVGPLAGGSLHVTYLSLPPLLWAAVRFGLREAATLSLLLSVVALASLSSHTGPFGASGAWAGTALMQAYLFVCATTALILAAAVWETKDQVRASNALAERLAASEEGLEEQVRRRTAELQRANAELEEFSYSVSHELRAPLRKIAVVSELVVREEGAALRPAALDRISRIRAAALRGNRIILDLLKLMRVSRLPLRRSEVDLSALARECACPGIELVVQPGLVARADPALTREIMAQLLDNACKFARAGAKPRVEVGRTSRPEGELFFVRDNGQGFEMDFSQKIFGTFERLHSSPDDGGTGVGLAIVQRAVARHGGKVFAEGKLGRGASFYFTLEGGAPA